VTAQRWLLLPPGPPPGMGGAEPAQDGRVTRCGVLTHLRNTRYTRPPASDMFFRNDKINRFHQRKVFLASHRIQIQFVGCTELVPRLDLLMPCPVHKRFLHMNYFTYKEQKRPIAYQIYLHTKGNHRKHQLQHLRKNI
jgi:hypothetical protein